MNKKWMQAMLSFAVFLAALGVLVPPSIAVAKVENSTTTIRTEASPLSVENCTWEAVTTRAKNLWGWDLFSFKQSVHWCYDKSARKVTFVDHDKIEEVWTSWASGWQWVGEDSGARINYQSPNKSYIITGHTGVFKNIGMISGSISRDGVNVNINPGGTYSMWTKMTLYWYGSSYYQISDN